MQRFTIFGLVLLSACASPVVLRDPATGQTAQCTSQAGGFFPIIAQHQVDECVSFEEIAKICLSSDWELAPIQHLELGPSLHAFSSPSRDLRFLGAFRKDLNSEDLAFAQGGVPAAAIIAFVGYGSYPVSVYVIAGSQGGNRTILGNGFHRVYALRSRGIERVPVVLQFAQNPLQILEQIADMPRDHLVRVPRPALVRDFLDGELTTVLRAKSRLRAVTIQVGTGQHDMPA